MDTKISVELYKPSQAGKWKQFLADSNNGTLFHDLDFLNYHRPGKFEIHHLMFLEGDRLLALLPAAIEVDDGHLFLKSPYGASIGGFVVPTALKVSTMLQIVRELQIYVSAQGLRGIELRIGPNTYLHKPDDLVPFSLMAHRFALIHRWLLFMVTIEGPPETLLDRLLSKTKRYDVRTNLKKGLQPREVDSGRLDEFSSLLSETYDRFGRSPTHSREDLADLVNRLPGKVRLFLCAYDGVEVAGVLLLVLNNTVANTFYICESAAHKKLCGPAVLVAHIIEQMAIEGFRYLDLGPSVSDVQFNEGVVFFKEGFGTRGFCRETWRWDSTSA
jgi:Acetyltransferase (GNAT) domain